jgi:hypothetical protein
MREHLHPARCQLGFHGLVTIYTRPWWKLFTKRYVIRCFYCELCIGEPRRLRFPGWEAGGPVIGPIMSPPRRPRP